MNLGDMEKKGGTQSERLKPEDLEAWGKKKPHERLGISKDATRAEIENAFWPLYMCYSPQFSERYPGLPANYAEVRKLLDDARNTLNDTRKREEEDTLNEKRAIEKREIEIFVQMCIEKLEVGGLDMFIKYDMNRLVAEGINRNKLIEALEPVALRIFWDNSKINLSRSSQIMAVKQEMERLVGLGIPKEKLMDILNLLALRAFRYKSKERLAENSRRQEAEQNIQDDMRRFVDLGIDEDKLRQIIRDLKEEA